VENTTGTSLLLFFGELALIIVGWVVFVHVAKTYRMLRRFLEREEQRATEQQQAAVASVGQAGSPQPRR
jgi:hypothetical protein